MSTPILRKAHVWALNLHQKQTENIKFVWYVQHLLQVRFLRNVQFIEEMSQQLLACTFGPLLPLWAPGKRRSRQAPIQQIANHHHADHPPRSAMLNCWQFSSGGGGCVPPRGPSICHRFYVYLNLRVKYATHILDTHRIPVVPRSKQSSITNFMVS